MQTSATQRKARNWRNIYVASDKQYCNFKRYLARPFDIEARTTTFAELKNIFQKDKLPRLKYRHRKHSFPAANKILFFLRRTAYDNVDACNGSLGPVRETSRSIQTWRQSRQTVLNNLQSLAESQLLPWNSLVICIYLWTFSKTAWSSSTKKGSSGIAPIRVFYVCFLLIEILT